MKEPREGDIDREIVPRAVDEQVDSELAFHLAMRERDLVARGVPAAEAREQALAAFGDMGGVRAELTRIGRASEGSARRLRLVAEAIQDARFAWRMVARRRAATLLIIVVLALGIGATTAIFSVVDGVLLRPLPFNEPDRLAAVWIGQPALANDPVLASLAEATPIGTEEYHAMRDATGSFVAIGLWNMGSATLTTEDGAEPVPVGVVTQSVFETLRVTPALGRTFTEGEDALGGADVGILSWETWRGRYGGDPAMLGRRIVLDGAPHTIIGVMPAGFRLDRTIEPPYVWVPAMQDSSDLAERHNRNYKAIARLGAGATFVGAAQQATPALREVTGDSSLVARVAMWQADQGRNASGPVLLLLAGAGLLLLIACVNVALLQLGEVSARRNEITVRVALGAGQGRLVRQLLGESLLLALIASALGAVLAAVMLRGLLAIAPERLPGLDSVRIDARVLGFALLTALATGLVFGVVPAWLVGRSGPAAAVRGGGGQTARGAAPLHRGLLSAQIAMSMVLLVMSVLLGQSLHRLTAVDPGFRADRLTALRVTMPWQYEDDQVRALTEGARRRIAELRGVSRVTLSSAPPYSGNSSSSPVTLDPSIAGERTPQHTVQQSVATDYFETMGVRIVEGRAFDAGDVFGGEPVAVVSEAMVRRDFGAHQAIGQRVRHQGVWRRVVGVAADVRGRSLAVTDGAGIYIPFDQNPNSGPTFLVRGEDAALETATLRGILRELDGQMVLRSVTRVPAAIERSYGAQRYRTILFTAFGALAALLAAVGLYGVSARTAARRLREVGIRMAVGGSPRSVARLLVGDAMRGVVLGIALGVPAAFGTAWALRAYLFEVSPAAPMAYLVVAAALAAATLAASAWPAWAATRADPVRVLRAE
ncbi:MAG: ADOP family duplicated permease [Gemmatimonadetes bacterium]|nr:ADOP family duplicated permease [Gemmatimonadota bacterium]